jgi:hypothetical protein
MSSPLSLSLNLPTKSDRIINYESSVSQHWHGSCVYANTIYRHFHVWRYTRYLNFSCSSSLFLPHFCISLGPPKTRDGARCSMDHPAVREGGVALGTPQSPPKTHTVTLRMVSPGLVHNPRVDARCCCCCLSERVWIVFDLGRNPVKSPFSDRYSVGVLLRHQASAARAAPSRRELTDTAAKRCHFFDAAPEGLVGAQRGGWRERGGRKTKRWRRRRSIRTTGKGFADRAQQQSPHQATP